MKPLELIHRAAARMRRVKEAVCEGAAA
eukprot:COSAG01_NODE_80198_length_122_cov_127.521739_1_plen_27_part_01